MQRPRVLQAFTKAEYEKAHQLLATKVAFMMGGNSRKATGRTSIVALKASQLEDGAISTLTWSLIALVSNTRCFGPPATSLFAMCSACD